MVVSLLLGFMGISGFFGMRNIKGLRVELEMPEEIYAGSAVPAKLILHNDKRFSPSFLIRIKVGGGETLFPVVERKCCLSGLVSMKFDRRGVHRVENIYVASVYPFNFFTRFRRLDLPLDVIVFPAPKKCSIASIFSVEKTSRGETSTDRAGYEADILSIRDYRYGDPKKYIHWKATARTGELKTKELSSLSHRPRIIDFDNLAIEDIEERISSVTYHIARSFRLNIPVGLRIGNAVYGTPEGRGGAGETGSGKIAMLKELALYGTD